MDNYILSEDLAVWFGKKKKKKGSSQPKVHGLIFVKKRKEVVIHLVVGKIRMKVRILCVEPRVLQVKCHNRQKTLLVEEKEKKKKMTENQVKVNHPVRLKLKIIKKRNLKTKVL